MRLADYYLQQFGVQTMADYGWFFHGRDDRKEDTSGPYALETLKENETIARLATGIKRFTLPDEFDFINIFRQIAARKDSFTQQAQEHLGQIFADRRQYDRAAEYWQLAGNQTMVKQVRDPWGQFEPIMTQPAGKGAQVDFRFRNGASVQFTARAIDTQKLLRDVRDNLAANPKRLDWQQMQVEYIGWHFVQDHPSQYLGEVVAQWKLPLAPRPGHFDKRITIDTPLKQPGAYLLTAKMADGNESRVVVWVADTILVKKALGNGSYYFVADAVTGQPLPHVSLDFFGYQMQWINNKDNHGGYNQVTTRHFTDTTDATGQLVVTGEEKERNYAWLVSTTGERLAYLGFSGIWGGPYNNMEYQSQKAFFITDRPVYRPDQTVKFKCWVNKPAYDLTGDSPFAGKPLTLRIYNPKNEKVYEKTLTADKFGGIDGEFPLEKNMTLGEYRLDLVDLPNWYGQGTFRVEEYKKPEYEVTVEAPEKPVALGEQITATIKAHYYFGAPVTHAKVHYKVLRTSYRAEWYPLSSWDWLYGAGYWWYAADTPWYPGWATWGCRRPFPSWWSRGEAQPELVAEADAPIDADGTVQVHIDTALAKAMYPDSDHRYEITAEVTDQSRRVIVGQGTVLVAREPFKVYAWVDRGHYRTGQPIQASFTAQTLDNRPVTGMGELRLLKISYRHEHGDVQPVETEVNRWRLNPDAQGQATKQLLADQPGQYRLSYTVTDADKHRIEGGYLFCVYGPGVDGRDFRFNELELVPDRRTYQPGERVQLAVNTDHADATVLLFTRPLNGVYLPPALLNLEGKSLRATITVEKKDMPNFFVEALTIHDGQVFTETREIAVPPEKRVLNVQVTPSNASCLPGAKTTVKVKLTDIDGKPYHGSTVVSIYDKAVEYISGGSNVPAIKDAFWKWRHNHYPRTEDSAQKGSGNLVPFGAVPMGFLGTFGDSIADEEQASERVVNGFRVGGAGGADGRFRHSVAAKKAMRAGNAVDAFAVLGSVNAQIPAAAPAAPAEATSVQSLSSVMNEAAPLVQPTVRTNFADTALWAGALETDTRGEATVALTMPESLTTWKARVWAMGDGARCGEGTAELVTTKHLLLRLQAPRFFTQKDEVVLSANVHNYLKTKKTVQVALELDGAKWMLCAGNISIGNREPHPIYIADMDGKDNDLRGMKQQITIPAGGEQRVDWRIRVEGPGLLTVRMKALTDEESDAMEQKFPVFVHGMLKTESFSGAIRPDGNTDTVHFTVPAERLPAQSRLEVRYSPTLAGAMVDALPYLVDYPYGCTEETLNRFLPTVLTQQTLLRAGVNLKEIQQKRTNLNAQEIGDDATRAQDWARGNPPNPGIEKREPVFDQAEVARMTQAGIERLASMQCDDGGWGWFSGWGEHSWPHTTALVVHGLQLARANGVQVPDELLQRGIHWLHDYQADQLSLLKLPPTDPHRKEFADEIDAFVFMVLTDANQSDHEMADFLYRDRTRLAVYAKSMLGLAYHKIGDIPRRDMLIRNITQYLVEDKEDQTAYLKLPENCWWYWYGSEYEAQAYYLKLLSLTDPHGETAPELVKYLLNNRKHATYWNSTRDTAIVVEALADYLKASGEDQPQMTVAVKLDGKLLKSVEITPQTLFSFDNKCVLTGDAVTAGAHTLEMSRTGKGPLYFNAYLTNFTLEDPITRAGLEVKVNRKFYKLTPVAATTSVADPRGQPQQERVEKYTRVELPNLALLKSGDLLEVELTIESKNDYEYLLFEDMKAAGCEPVDVRSGYTGNEMGAYVELRDERVCLFVRQLARGTHSLSYRLRAEIPGRFSALPTRASALYAPELKANSDEMKIQIED